MNGLESPTGGEMTKATQAPKPRWTLKEKQTGEKILDYIDNHIDSNNVADVYGQASKAAIALGILAAGQTFRDIQPNVKAYLSFVWRMQSPEERVKRNLADMRKEYDEKLKDPDFLASRIENADELAEAIHKRDDQLLH